MTQAFIDYEREVDSHFGFQTEPLMALHEGPEALPTLTPVLAETSMLRFGVIAAGDTIFDAPAFDAAARLRADVYVRQQRFLPEEVLDEKGRELDADDAASIHFAVMDNQSPVDDPEVIAVTRFVSGALTEKLPVERHFGIQPDRPQQSIEVSRFIASNSNKAKERLGSMVLLAMTIGAITEHDFDAYAILERGLVRRLSMNGVAIEQLAEPVVVEKYGYTKNMPVAIGGEASLQKAAAKENKNPNFVFAELYRLAAMQDKAALESHLNQMHTAVGLAA